LPATVLLVEDNPITRKMYRAALEHAGHRVIEAGSGRAAVEALEQATPDLIIQDLALPDTDGFQLVRRLRALPAGASVPILACSAFAPALEDPEIVSLGFTGFIAKPVEPSRLVKIVRDHLALGGPNGSGVGRGRRVLVVDDDPLRLELLGLSLSRLGFTVDTAHGADEALELARATPPAAVVTDIHMPGSDGFSLCVALRSEPELAGVPVVLYSALSSGGAEAVARRVGASAFVACTSEFQEIIDALQAALRGGTGAPSAAADLTGEERLEHLRAQLGRQVSRNGVLTERLALQDAALSALSSLGEALASARDLEGAVRDTLAKCLEAAGISMSALYLAQPDGTWRLHSASGYEGTGLGAVARFFGDEPLVRAIAAARVPVALPDGAKGSDAGGTFARRAGGISALLVPLVAGAECNGLILLVSDDRNLAEDHWLAFARTISTQFGQAMRLLSRQRELEAIVRAADVFTGSLSVETICHRLTETARTLLEARSVVLWLAGADGDLEAAATLGSTDSRVGDVIPAGTGFPGRALAMGVVMTSPDVEGEPDLGLPADLRERIVQSGCTAVAAVPLRANGRPIGALTVRDTTGRRFSPDQTSALQGLADQAALALGNARAFEESERRRREAELVAELVRTINESLELSEILQRVVEAAKEICRADIAHIALRDPDAPDTLRMRHAAGLQSSIPLEAVVRRAGLGGRVFETGRSIRTERYAEDPAITRDYIGAAGAEGVIAVLGTPVRVREEIAGVLVVSNRTPRAFTDRDEQTLERLADHAGIAIQNAEQLEHLRIHQQNLEALLAVNLRLAETRPIEDLLGDIAEACGRLVGATSVRFRRVEDDDLVVGASWGESSFALPADRVPLAAEPWKSLVMAESHLLIADPATSPRLERWVRDAIRTVGYRTWLGVPVRSGDRVLGTLSVVTTRPRGFSPEDVAIAVSLAAQAGAALESARLFGEAQKAYDELSRTQEQLVQSQKMEAIGQLAGGVAHDFNNLLTVILGRSHMLQKQVEGEKPRRALQLIAETAERAARLTAQLLAFSRKQVLEPKVMTLNTVVTGVEKILRRVIGEDVTLITDLDADLGRVLADPGQLEQVLLNLVVNARDAMPEGGELVIRTANVEHDAVARYAHSEARPGQYVMLAVSDTGCGMDAATRARIFEPFFTTKPTGKGTGLGLATVFGIVKQSGGQVCVDSEPGVGSTFRVYLPLVADSAEAERPESSAIPSGAETILLVEDEPELRELTEEMLTVQGYRVLPARDAEEALQIAAAHPGGIDLLLTDVVMPRMSGRVLVERLVEARPGVRVLYMSGYTDDTISHHGVLAPGIALLAKPFTAPGLARKVRDVLDAPRLPEVGPSGQPVA
jgi:CheY-like chemotaxis protein/GAF domain-containing protein